jgi:hypothetical protein
MEACEETQGKEKELLEAGEPQEFTWVINFRNVISQPMTLSSGAKESRGPNCPAENIRICLAKSSEPSYDVTGKGFKRAVF